MPSKSPRRSTNAPPTSGDVARAAGVSRTTVSYVLNDIESGRISAATRDRVLEAARDLGYVPHAVARALRAGHSGIILLTTPSVTAGPLFAHSFSEFQVALAGRGYTAVLHGPTGRSGADAARRWAELRPDAVLSVMDESLDEEAVRVLHSVGISVVLSAGTAPVPGAHTLLMDQHQVGATAVHHLAGTGHRRIGVVVPEDDTLHRFALPRLAGAEVAARSHPGVDVIRQDLELTEEAALAWSEHHVTHRLDAVFAYNDEYATLVMRALLDKGIRVPEDVAVVGADDLLIGRLLRPRLTTVRMDFTPAGELAALVDRLVGTPEAEAEIHNFLTARLIARESA